MIRRYGSPAEKFGPYRSGVFELRGKTIYVAQADVYGSSRWDAPVSAEITDEEIVIVGLIFTRRSRESGFAEQEPFAYVDEDKTSGTGIWLNEAIWEEA